MWWRALSSPPCPHFRSQRGTQRASGPASDAVLARLGPARVLEGAETAEATQRSAAAEAAREAEEAASHLRSELGAEKSRCEGLAKRVDTAERAREVLEEDISQWRAATEQKMRTIEMQRKQLVQAENARREAEEEGERRVREAKAAGEKALQEAQAAHERAVDEMEHKAAQCVSGGGCWFEGRRHTTPIAVPRSTPPPLHTHTYIRQGMRPPLTISPPTRHRSLEEAERKGEAARKAAVREGEEALARERARWDQDKEQAERCVWWWSSWARSHEGWVEGFLPLTPPPCACLLQRARRRPSQGEGGGGAGARGARARPPRTPAP